jgi:hypothetical protein
MKVLLASVALSGLALSPACACNGGGNCENAPGPVESGLGIAVG